MGGHTRTPLAGLTGEQADEAIERLQAKIEELQESIKASREHLKELKAARKDLADPQPTGNGVVATAQTAEVGVDARQNAELNTEEGGS